MTNVIFNWSIPATPNGIITQYNLTVVNLDTPNTTSYIIDVTADQQQVSQLVTGFRPYENYTATVTGTTLVGYGPVAVTKGRTKPDCKILPLLLLYSFCTVSSPPNLVTIPVVLAGVIFTTLPVINDTAINITWTTPTNSNGFISSYSVKITTSLSTSISVNADKTSYTIIYGGLSMLSTKCLFINYY